MILKGSQRAGGTQLAIHLLKTDENEHVEIHEISGFMSGTPMEAFNEAYAISRGTKCRQYLFSLSLSPPENESVPVEVFEKALSDIENKIGLAGQPRVIVFHEKEGRRHAHCVWSRIDVEKMKAVNLPHFKLKLRDISRELYLEHGWQMPRGFVNSEERNPLNFTQAEWQQAKRVKQDPRAIKEAFRIAGQYQIQEPPLLTHWKNVATILPRVIDEALSPLTGVAKSMRFPAGLVLRPKTSKQGLAVLINYPLLKKLNIIWQKNSLPSSTNLLMKQCLPMTKQNYFSSKNAKHLPVATNTNALN